MAHYLITHQVKDDKAKTLAQCSICEKDFENKHTLKRHIQRVHERKKNFKCSICSMTCLDNWKLKRHKKLHLNPNYVPIIRGYRKKKKHFKCEICAKLFHESWKLKRHEKVHDPYTDKHKNGRGGICSHCGVFYNCLQQHIKARRAPEWREHLILTL